GESQSNGCAPHWACLPSCLVLDISVEGQFGWIQEVYIPNFEPSQEIFLRTLLLEFEVHRKIGCLILLPLGQNLFKIDRAFGKLKSIHTFILTVKVLHTRHGYR